MARSADQYVIAAVADHGVVAIATIEIVIAVQGAVQAGIRFFPVVQFVAGEHVMSCRAE